MITLYTSVGRYELRKRRKAADCKSRSKGNGIKQRGTAALVLPDVGDSDERRSKNLFFEEGCEDGRFSGTL